MKAEILTVIAAVRLVPVVVLQSQKQAVGLGRALVAGGLPIAEVTFRTAAAAASIKAMRADVPELLVGAGTVISLAQVDDAIAAGASFIVTPGFNPRVVQYCLDQSVPIVPGANAPGFIEAAMEFGLDLLKFFPAEPSGGTAFLKALAGPYSNVRFIPTGGISTSNLRSYLALSNVVACGGSWMVDPATIGAADFATISRLSRDAVQLAAQ
jgi:2-dehydro-3-deoxyphosphogluconate aldolase/(4S)-4-hydroxy-2-oxoglutarate aldolase